MSDRQSIRSQAEEWIREGPGTSVTFRGRPIVDDLADHCLALLAELEQAERERDEMETELVRRQDNNYLDEKLSDAEARLAKVTALVDAIRRVADVCESPEQPLPGVMLRLSGYLRAALAAWEAE